MADQEPTLSKEYVQQQQELMELDLKVLDADYERKRIELIQNINNMIALIKDLK